MKKVHWTRLILLIAIPEAVGFLSSMLSGDMKGVYAQLIKPPLSPPGWIFGVVWPILFALMGIAVYLIVEAEGKRKSDALFWFFVQLGVNFLWSILFFRFQLYWASLVCLIILDLLVVYTMRLFRRIDRRAWWLLLPYLIWILFATYLNAGVALLNG